MAGDFGIGGAAGKRKPRRLPLSQPCWVDTGPDNLPIGCHISNISPSGALLVAERIDLIPDEFNLYLTRDGLVGRKCRVVGRTGNEIGLRFAGRNVPRPNWPERIEL